MRILLTGLFALAGCHAAAPDNGTAANGPQPNEATIENEFASQQAALAASIENDANTDDADDNDSSDGAKSYSCDNNLAVTVTYTDDGNATLVSGGKTLALKAVTAASGAKYRTDTGLAPGKSLTWWSKGDGAMLIQGAKGAKEGAAGETMANCLATDPDQ